MPSVCAPSTSSGIRLDVLVRGGLQREEADLGSVAVRQHELVLLGDGCERPGGDSDVGALDVLGHRLAALQQCVAPEGDQNSHARTLSRTLSSPASRRATP